MLIDELIEKAFSDGYEYALMEQREFGVVKQANKMAKKAWEANQPLAKNYGIRTQRRANSPMAMMNGSWAKDMGASKLQTNISRSDKKFLRRLSGRNQHMGPLGPISGGGYI